MSNSKHIYLVRHGLSESNKTGIMDGGESPLAEEGVKQAKLVAKRFKNIPIEVVLSSHYKRAQETGMEIVKEVGVPFEVVSMAHENEISTSIHGLRESDAEFQEIRKSRDANWINGVEEESQESYTFILNRVTELTALLESRNEKHIAVTSHGFFLKLFTAHHFLGDYLTPENFLKSINQVMKSTNTGITYFTIDEENQWTLRAWNDHAHLGEIHS